MLLKYVINQ
jgi:hypothetical protein